jgi:WD40 repeat protein
MHNYISAFFLPERAACGVAGRVPAVGIALAVTLVLFVVRPGQGRAQVRPLPPLRAQPVPGSVVSVAFTADGKLLAATYIARGRAIAKVWDVATSKVLVTLASKADLTKDPVPSLMSVAFSPDGKTLALAGTRERTQLYDTATWKVRDELFVPNRPDVYGDQQVAFAPDGKKLATVRQYGGLVRLWDNPSGRVLYMLGAEAGISPDAIAFSPDGKTIAGAGTGGVVLWDLAQRGHKATLQGPNRRAKALAFGPNGKVLAAAWEGFREKHVLVWDLPSHKAKVRLDMGGKYSGEARALAFSQDGRFLLVLGGAPGQKMSHKPGAPVVFLSGSRVRLWDLSPGCDLECLKLPMSCNCLAFSPTPPVVAVGGLDGVVYLYDLTKLAKKH